MTRQSVYDLLCLLNSSKKVKQVQQVGILPECHLIPLEITRKTREFIADADEYSDRESGDDPSEIYQIREYREKDSIHDIHWKLSAKSDDILVKEHGRPLGEAVLIWLDLNEDELSGRKRKHKIKNVPVNMLELVASLSYSLSEEKCVHMVAWYEPENQQIRKKRISKEEHIYELLNRIMFVKLNQNIEEAKCRYEEAFRGEDFSTVVILKTDGTVSIGEETIMIPVENKEIVWDKLYFTL